MFLLDTDHLSIMQRRTGLDWERLDRKLDEIEVNLIFASMVSFHEQTRGAHNFVNQATKPNDLQRGYDAFKVILECYSELNTVSYDDAAHREFERFKRAKVRIGTMDLRIAATALSHGWTLVTRNTRDFQKVPGLKFEDWTA